MSLEDKGKVEPKQELPQDFDIAELLKAILSEDKPTHKP